MHDKIRSEKLGTSRPVPENLPDASFRTMTDDGLAHLTAGGDAETGFTFFIRMVVDGRQGAVALAATAVAAQELGALVELVAA